MLEDESRVPAMAKNCVGDAASDADLDEGRVDCVACGILSEKPCPLRPCNQRSLSEATYIKCRRSAGICRGQVTLLVLGITFVTIAAAIFIFDPLDLLISKRLSFSDGSFVFETWKKPPITAKTSIYVFNVTNSDGFLNNGEKLKVEELGPYVYHEHIENTNVKFNDNNTITYTPLRTTVFAEELSERDPRKDIVILPNIALIGVASAAHNFPFFVSMAVNSLANSLDAKPFITVTVDDLLWGYDDPLVTIAHTLLPNFVPFDKLGALDVLRRQIDTLTMNIGTETHMNENPKLYTLDNANGSPGLDYWGYGETYTVTENGTAVPALRRCNAVQGTYEGVIFPRNMPKNQTLWLYRKSSCRPLPFVFQREETLDGLKSHRYKFKDNVFEPATNNPENDCYCDNKKKACLPPGLADISPCYYTIPASISFPHFYKADERLARAIEGMSPDQKKHESYLSIQPELGVPISGHCKIQTNLIAKTRRVRSVAAFHNMFVPLLWVDAYVDSLPKDMLFLMRLSLNEAPIIQKVLAVLFLVSGLCLMLVVAARLHFPVKCRRQKFYFVEREEDNKL